MRLFRTFAFAAMVALAGCGQPNGALKPIKTTEAKLDKLVETLSAESFVEKAQGEPDIAGIVAALPEGVAVTYASSALDAASGAMMVKDIRITAADNTAVGVAIGELKAWGLDSDFLKARLAGQRLAETKKLASRIEVGNVSVFGLDTLMAPAMEAYTDTIADLAENVAPDPALAAATQVTMSNYDISLQRAIFDEVVLRPWEMKPVSLPADSEWTEAMPVLQQLTAFYRTLAFNAAVFSGMNGEVDMTQGGQRMAMKFSIASSAAHGWRGGDVDFSVTNKMEYGGTMIIPTGETVIIEDPAAPDAPAVVPDAARAEPPTPVSLDMIQSVEKAVVSGVRLDKVMGYLARGVMPPRTETDLMSLGVFRADGTRIGMNGAALYTIAETSYDLSSFHWFVPNAGRMSFKDMAIDIVGFADFMEATTNGLVADGQTPTLMPAGVKETLARHGLDKPSFDGDFGWNWNPATGATSFDTAFGFDGYTRFDARADFTFPAFKAVSDLIPETGEADEEALGALFEKTFAFKGAQADLVDEGGLEKGFAAAGDFAKLIPADDPNMAMFRSQTAEQIRGMAVSGAYFLADSAGQQVPELTALFRPLAAWVRDGGKVRMVIKPKTPITSADFSTVTEPSAIVERLGVTVTHTPAPGTKKPN